MITPQIIEIGRIACEKYSGHTDEAELKYLLSHSLLQCQTSSKLIVLEYSSKTEVSMDYSVIIL